MGASLCKRLCGFCLGTVKWIPVIFITAIIVWSYYTYVVRLCYLKIPDLDGWGVSIVLILSFHLFFIPLVWSYHRVIFTTPGYVPARFDLSISDMDAIESASNSRLALERLVVDRDLPVFMRSLRDEVRYCSECVNIKPDRSHHCSVCGACVLKMDHHCPWVNNCIGFANYKFFILFLFYTTTYCLFVALSTLRYCLAFWSSWSGNDGDGHVYIFFLFFGSAMFCVTVLSLLSYHMYLVCHNQTTLESFRAPTFRHGSAQGDKRAFHLGTLNNLQEVFGDNRILWFVPVFTSLGDGIVYPLRDVVVDEERARVGDVERGRRPWDGSGSEEMVPMFHATRFESDDDEEGSKLVDRHAKLSTTSSSGISAGSAAVLDVEESENRLSTQVHTRSPRQDPVLDDQLVAVDMA